MSIRRHTVRRTLVALCVVGGMVMGGRLAADFPPPYHTERAAINTAARKLAASADGAALTDYLREFVENKERPLVIREYAITRLGELEIKGAEGHLLKLSEYGDDPVVRNAARRSYWMVRVEGLEPNERHEELAKLLRGDSEPSSSSVRLWAAHEFCGEGDAGAVDMVAKALTEILGEERRSEEILLCRLQVEAISRSATRQAGLVQALSTPDPTAFGRFHLWALEELGQLGTSDARSALVNHALRLQEGDVKETWQELSATVRALREMDVSKDDLIREGISARLLAGVE
jgi:hypothetical protein